MCDHVSIEVLGQARGAKRSRSSRLDNLSELGELIVLSLTLKP